MAETTLSASDDGLVGKPVCGFLGSFWLQMDIDFIGALRVDATVASFHYARLVVNDIIRHRLRTT